MSKGLFNDWLNLVKDIFNELPKKPALICPKCGYASVDYQYVGDLETKIGYLDVWCNDCLNGIHISRTKIPETANALSFDSSPEEIRKRIPSFVQIFPIEK